MRQHTAITYPPFGHPSITTITMASDAADDASLEATSNGIADRNEGDTAYILHMAAMKKIAANEDDYGSQERLVAKFLTMDHQARVTGVARTDGHPIGELGDYGYGDNDRDRSSQIIINDQRRLMVARAD